MALRNSIAHTHGVYNKDERPRGKSLGQKDLCVKTYSATQTFEKYEVLKNTTRNVHGSLISVLTVKEMLLFFPRQNNL